MKIVAQIERSAGNETIGDMWIETACFDETASIKDVFKWADSRLCRSERDNPFHGREGLNIKLSIMQEP